jgi:hypothetical protein
LNGELVAQLLESSFVGGGEGEEVEAEADLGGFDLVVEDRGALVDELEESGDLGLPVDDEGFPVLVATGELDGGDDEWWEGPPNAVASFRELLASGLEKL